MINYAYPTLFLTEGTQKDLLITDGTITVVGTTYTVSDETVLFTNSDLEEEAFELTQSLCSEMQLTFGCCETSKISFTVRKSYNTNIVGTVINLYIIPNHDASKMLQLGVFKIYEDQESDSHDRHFITAYDAMYEILNADVSEWYDTLLPNKTSVVKLSVFRTSFLSHFGLSYGGTLPNDSLDIRRTIEVRNADGDLEPLSGATIIKAICELNSVFGVIVNTGAFRFRRLIATLETSDSLYEIPVSNYIDVQEGEYSLPIKKVILRTGKSTVQTTQQTIDPYNTYVVSNNPLISDYNRVEATEALGVLANSAFRHGYSAFSINALGNPLVEVGDGVKITKPNGDYIYSYVFERKWSGIQALRDTYSANASKYLSEDLNTYYTQNKAIESQISQIAQSASGSGVDFVETIRNIGFRLLDEPSNVLAEYDEDNNEVSIKWTDPADINTNEPSPCEWVGTVVVRKEGSAPRHRWDGIEIEDSITRDAYSSSALVDNTIDENKDYYYGIFPYDTKGDYRFTKVVEVISGTYQRVFEFAFEGNQTQTFFAPRSGKYLLEVWGASGGKGSVQAGQPQHSLGGYSQGVIQLNQNDALYIMVGGEGEGPELHYQSSAGGVNGGGSGGAGYYDNYYSGGGGGGATHIAKADYGELKNYDSHRSDVIIVAGGGGGTAGASFDISLYSQGIQSGGGYKGQDGYTQINYGTFPSGGTQNSGYQFGLGENGASGQYGSAAGEGRGGGGGGWYGGKARTDASTTADYTNAGGGGGSGYINTTLLSDAYMAGYYVDTSSSDATKTISVTDYSSDPETDKAKQGNGYARITWVGV